MKPTAYLTTFLGLPGASGEKRAACNFDLTSRYFYNVSSEESFFQTIDAETTADLDLNAVFERIDRTASKPGQQYLYARLRTLRGTEEVREFGRRTDHFAGNAGHAEQCAKHLSRLSDDDAYDLQNLIFDKPEQVRRIALVYLLSAAAVASLLLSFLYPLLLLLFLAVFAANMYIHYSNKLNISIYASAVKQLTLALRTARHLAAEEVPGTEEALKVIRQVSEVERRSRVVGTQGDSANELAAAVWLVFELVKAAFNVEVILFHRFIGSIIARRDAIHGLFRFIGETDAAISAAACAAKRRPAVRNSPTGNACGSKRSYIRSSRTACPTRWSWTARGCCSPGPTCRARPRSSARWYSTPCWPKRSTSVSPRPTRLRT